jgi:hypothetical protein
MRSSTRIVIGALAAAWCAVAAWAATPPAKPAVAPPISAAAAEFFEKHVRPVLAENCYSCHGPKLQQSGLRVDSLAGLLRGADGGRPSLVKGEPDKSPLIQVLQHTGGVKMPPKGKLPQPAIEALTQWVKMGAPWPGGEPSAGATPKDPAQHWAFQPVRKPSPPAVKNRKWVKSPVDAFVLANLERNGMQPSRGADRRTLIRRAYLDLIGLPPSAADVDAFVADKSPSAFATVVDRLLASPQYGERWARYWLDVARYADTKGYVFQEERRYPHAYTYRDWVIRALNEDIPYDRFLKLQIAGDHLVTGDDKRDLAAMGFLTLGRRFLNNQADIIDDRLDVVFRGTQSLTVGCARCHDHKFDPIPTADYYSLYGVFASSSEPKDPPLIAAPERSEAYLAYERQLGVLQGAVDTFLKQKHEEWQKKAMAKIADSLLAVRDLERGGDVRGIGAKYGLPGELVRRWQTFLGETRKGHHPLFAPWFAFAALPDAEFAAQAGPLAARFAANQDAARLLHPRVAGAFGGRPPANLQDVATRLAGVLNTPNGDQQIEHALDSIGGPLNFDVAMVQRFFERDERNRLQALQQKVDAFKATSPAAPARAMVLVDNAQPVNPRIFRRGNPNSPGDAVPRQFLAVLSGPQRKPFTKGSGRLELAESIANPANPLTARVMVNRVWAWHFGGGLVRTPSDFGLRSDPPSNPALLDFLAASFVEGGWSLKKLHRLMMLSSTYQQASDENPAYLAKDPENAWLWRMNRRRLDFEAMRDSLLWAGGDLDLTPGGAAVDITRPEVRRRTVYGFIDRQNLPNVFRTFDFSSPDAHTPQRFNTSVPQQALFLMNSPFLIQQAKKAAARPEIAETKSPPERVQALFRLLYGRAAEPEEVEASLAFLRDAEGPADSAAGTQQQTWSYGYGEASLDGKVRTFHRLPHFTGTAWQGGPRLPDPTTGWVILNGGGGHAGNDKAHAAIRRWTAPQDGVFQVTGVVAHPIAQGDGVRARIISSRADVLGTWVVHNGRAEAHVTAQLKAGDTLDFVVDCRNDPTHDSFQWAPVITLAPGKVWSAADHFGGPAALSAQRLSPWEKYAQVLLLSNEFMFVD